MTPPVWLSMSGCVEKEASTHHFISRIQLVVRFNVNCCVDLRYFISKLHIEDTICTNFLYGDGASCTSNSAIFPWSFRCTISSYISACMNAPGMSTVATSLFSIPSIMHDIISASIATVGEPASSLFVCIPCL